MKKGGRYTRFGKVSAPITDDEFNDGINTGTFVKGDLHRAYCVLLYYTALRRGEALKVNRDQFTILHGVIWFNVGERFKASKETSDLPLRLDVQHIEYLVKVIEQTKPHEKLFRFCPKTAYNIVRRVWKYPHLFRLTRITWFLGKGFSTAQVRNWTGLSLAALDFYVGKMDVKAMGDSLAHNSTS